jgi:hypothetical protein
MILGDKAVDQAFPAAIDTAGTRLLALGVLVCCGVAVNWLVDLGAAF